MGSPDLPDIPRNFLRHLCRPPHESGGRPAALRRVAASWDTQHDQPSPSPGSAARTGISFPTWMSNSMSTRRIGIWFIGACGGVSSTVALGLAALKRGLVDTV